MSIAPNGSKRNYGHGGSLVLRFAEATDRTPGSASQRLRGNQRLDRDNLAYLTLLRERGDFAGIRAHIEPQLAIAQDIDPEPYTTPLLLEKAQADADEDAALVRFQADSVDGLSLEEVTRYRKEVGEELRLVTKLYDSLVAKENELRGRPA